MDPISAIIVDDEPLAREGLSIRLGAYGGFSVLAKCKNGGEALATIAAKSPDVVFVDIEMPGINGIEVIESLCQTKASMPIVVFVTAFKDFAFRAFDCQAFDYILKPYSEERLGKCLRKISSAVQQKKALVQQSELDTLLSKKTGKSLSGFMQTLSQSNQFQLHDLEQTIALKSGTEWLRLKLDDILWLESAGDYVYVHTANGNHIIRKTLKTLHQALCQERFVRLNRSAIVNVANIAKLTPNSNGEYVAHLHSGGSIKVSRRYRLTLRELNTQSV